MKPEIAGMRVTDLDPSRWQIECLICARRWALIKRGALHGGNILALLNHVAGHDAKPT